MSEPYVPLARAFHDLNGVHTIEVTGWPGRCEVRSHAISNPGVSVLAPRRTSTEFWTFAPQQDGVLRCFTDLIAYPHLLTDPGEPMVILLPADRIDSICIGFRDGAEGRPRCRAPLSRYRPPVFHVKQPPRRTVRR